ILADQSDSTKCRLELLIPLVVLVIAATAIPVELRPLDLATFDLHFSVSDFILNILGYAPLGVVLARRGFWRTVVFAALLSLFAETCQLFMMHRFPSPWDLAANVAGAALGLQIARRWRIAAVQISVNPQAAWLSAVAALAIVGLAAIFNWKEL